MALIERWQSETYTFHLRTSKATITLQDAEPQVLPPYRDELTRLTGFVAPAGDISGQSRLLLSALCAHLRLIDMQHPIGEDMPRADVDRSAHLYLLIIFRAILFPNTSGSHVSLMYLRYIDDLAELGCYSWGATVLGYMYRGFCRCSMGTRVEVPAFCSLLQIWVWTRLRPFQPIPTHPPADYFAVPVPYARRWSRGVRRCAETYHNLLPFRDQLDRMKAQTAFIWTSYDHNLDELSAFCQYM
ncbi:protein MAIN-LIKE 2-like [Lycium ferocissimum]|uniref:protein MAIN-LIKE 2-like n=1 Tax=Lycium ferocissimum TaxID=112874 RepID=UPI002815FC62|nr:protein MAIN-LIKE 2-like [Lycium ferocissimum]